MEVVVVVDVEVVAILNFGLVGFRSAEIAFVNRIPYRASRSHLFSRMLALLSLGSVDFSLIPHESTVLTSRLTPEYTCHTCTPLQRENDLEKALARVVGSESECSIPDWRWMEIRCLEFSREEDESNWIRVERHTAFGSW